MIESNYTQINTLNPNNALSKSLKRSREDDKVSNKAVEALFNPIDQNLKRVVAAKIASEGSSSPETSEQEMDSISKQLYLAAFHGQWDAVRELIRNHPNVNVNASPIEGPDRGTTPLFFAANAGEWDIVKLLLKQWDTVRELLPSHPGVNVNASPKEGPDRGKTVLSIAAVAGQWEIVREIVENHPEVNVYAAASEGKDQGITALSSAMYYFQDEITNIIFDHLLPTIAPTRQDCVHVATFGERDIHSQA